MSRRASRSRSTAPKIEMERFLASPRVRSDEHLHLAVSMRSFRAEALSEFVGHIVENEPGRRARLPTRSLQATYPIYLTRELNAARDLAT